MAAIRQKQTPEAIIVLRPVEKDGSDRPACGCGCGCS